VKVDLADDRFDIRYDSEGTSPEALLKLVAELGFKGRIVVTKLSGPDAPLPAGGMDLARLPAFLVEPFARARESQRPLLLDFGSPG